MLTICNRNAKGQLISVNGSRRIPAHLKSIRIPPAWIDIQVETDPTAKVWATGTDGKGRRQSVQAPHYAAANSAAKFANLRTLMAKAEELRSQIELDCKEDGSDWTEEATVAYLILETGLRPGSNADTGADVRAFGATTLQARHVQVTPAGRVYLDFVGKKGVRNHLRVTNPWLVEQLIARKQAAGSRYSTSLFSISDAQLRTYVKAVGEFVGVSIKVKDFRTMRGTMVAMAALNGRRIPSVKTKRAKLMRTVIATVAKTLGNTPAVAKKSYIDPVVLAVFA